MNGLLDDPWVNFGMGLLSASGPSRRPVGLGQAMLGGLQTMEAAEERVAKRSDRETIKQMNALKMAQVQMEMAEIQRKQAALGQFSSSLPPEQRAMVESLGAQALPYIMEKKKDAEAQARSQELLGRIAPYLGGQVEIPQVEGVVAKADGIPEMPDSAKDQFMGELQKRIKAGDPEAQSMATFAIQKGWMPSSVNKPADYGTALNIALSGGNAGKDIASTITTLMNNQGTREDRALTREQNLLLAQLTAGNKQPPAPSVTEITDPKDPSRVLSVDTRVYKSGGTLGDPGVIGVAKGGITGDVGKPMTEAQTLKLRTTMNSDRKQVGQISQENKFLKNEVDRLLNHPGLSGMTGAEAYLPSFPSSPLTQGNAKAAENIFEGIRGRTMSLGRAIQSQSGKLGNMAVKEWKYVADALAALDPKSKDFPNQLKNLIAQMDGLEARMKESYETTYEPYFERKGFQSFKLENIPEGGGQPKGGVQPKGNGKNSSISGGGWSATVVK